MKKQFDRDISALGTVFEYTGDFASANSLSESVVFAMNLAIEELFTNIVKYSAKNSNQVGIDLAIEDNELTIQIMDFDVEEFDVTNGNEVDVNLPIEQRRPGGIGLYLVRNIVDKITYEYKDRMACITLVKRLEEQDV